MYYDEVLSHQPFETHREKGSLALPVALTLLGIGALSLAIIIASRAKNEPYVEEEETYGVENYEVVKDKPFIYSICE